MIYFLSILLGLQILVILWFVLKNTTVLKQRDLLSMVQEINTLKEETENMEMDIKQTESEIMAQSEFLEKIYEEIKYQASMVRHKMRILQKIAPSNFYDYIERITNNKS